MSAYDFDVLVIGGGGSAGFTAATTAMKNGARVAMVESDRLGGLCILAGCMPSKALIHSADNLRRQNADRLAAYPGVQEFRLGVVDFLAQRRAQAVAAKQQQGLELLRGRARFLDAHAVAVDGKPVSAASIVIATGSVEVIPDVPGLAQSGYLTSETFLALERPPRSLLVLGGGTMALELAQYARRMGVSVSIVQRGQALLSKEDPAIGQILAQCLAEEGVELFLGTQLLDVTKTTGGARARFIHQGQERAIEAEALLLSLGRRPNSDGLDLAAAGVATGPGGAVTVDQFMRASAPHIFAAGDVTARLMVVNQAIVEGQCAGHNASSDKPKAIDDRVVPRAVFTDPQVARVGPSAAQAQAAGVDFRQASYDLAELGAAQTYPGGVRGLMNLRAETKSGRIIGADLVAPEASLMIHDVAVAMKLGGTAADLADIPYVHPCLAEISELTAGRLARMVGR